MQLFISLIYIPSNNFHHLVKLNQAIVFLQWHEYSLKIVHMDSYYLVFHVAMMPWMLLTVL